jgi:ankyrin repeat protein
MAASEGHLETVKYLVQHGSFLAHKDIRGNTALDDAKRENRQNVIQFLQSALAET